MVATRQVRDSARKVSSSAGVMAIDRPRRCCEMAITYVSLGRTRNRVAGTAAVIVD
jgi:hypothetical protein